MSHRVSFRRISRRELLRSAALGGAGLAGAYLLGCGGEGDGEPQPAGPTPIRSPTLESRIAPPYSSLNWQQLAPAGAPPPARRDHSLVTDGFRLYAFGGRSPEALADLWSYDIGANAWTQVTAQGGPAARFGHNAVWDAGTELMVVFGGQATDGSFFNDLWAFDPVSARWTELPAGATAPAARYGAGAAYDPAGRLLITHGFTSSGRFDDTWAYDFAAGAWGDISPAGERPLERCLMRAAWHQLQYRLIIFGGQTTSTPFLGDLWSLAEGRWRELLRQPAPSPRNLYAMGFDEETGTLIIFGGATEGGPANDLWFFNALEEFWTAGPADEPRPSPRFGHDGAWLAERGSFYVFGGNDGGAMLNDLWRLSVAA